VPTLRTYAVTVKWTHRKWGPQFVKLKAEATSIRRAISHALLAFFSDRSNPNGRGARLDAHGQLTVSAQRMPKPTAQR
jgi:hypothetical protein